MPAERKITTEHEAIQRWAEERGAKPSTVKGTAEEGSAGVLRLEFPGRRDSGKLEQISWEQFFRKFDEKGLAFLYQDRTSDGRPSRFFKLIRKEGATLERPKRRPSRPGAAQGAGNGQRPSAAPARQAEQPVAYTPLEQPDPPASEALD